MRVAQICICNTFVFHFDSNSSFANTQWKKESMTQRESQLKAKALRLSYRDQHKQLQKLLLPGPISCKSWMN